VGNYPITTLNLVSPQFLWITLSVIAYIPAYPIER
jgi:hypothetical protein